VNHLARIYDGTLDGLAFIAAALLLAITIGIGVDVGSRYFFDMPIGWMSELVQHSMLLMLFLSIGWVTRERGHVAVEILLDRLPRRYRRTLEFVALLTSSAICAFVGVWAAIGARDNYLRAVMTDGIYPVPRYWLIAVVALGLVLTAVEFLRMATQMVLHPDLEVRQTDSELEALAIVARAKSEREQLP
jgi:TRAP-type C4-dicarboxylate transport system permease small subunit